MFKFSAGFSGIGKIILGVLVVIVVGLVGASSYHRLKRIEHRATGQAPGATASIPKDMSNVRSTLERAFNRSDDIGRNVPNKFAPGQKFYSFYLSPRSNQLFPEELQLQAELQSQPSVELKRYLSIPEALRQTDYYLSSNADDYWASEYYYKGQPAPFRSNFIIHLEPAGVASTKIEVFEYAPIIWVGKYFDPIGHSGPGLYRDIRKVEPTVKDKQEVLDIIKKRM